MMIDATLIHIVYLIEYKVSASGFIAGGIVYVTGFF